MLDKKRKLKLLAEQNGWICKYCKCELNWQTATIDHIKPTSLGGSNKLDNLALACLGCNNRKGNKLVFEKTWWPKNWPAYLKE